jgi:addiction module HigA family antidote
MEFAERAFVVRVQGNIEESTKLFEKALENELAAISKLEAEGRVEPTYSVLHRSAGTLALDCNQPRKAEQIATKALAQDPPQEIADELRELLHRILSFLKDQKRIIPPTHPGAMLREDFLPDYALTADSLADELGESRQTIRELLQEQCAISSIMALKLSRLFRNSPEFWLSVQHARDLWELEQQYRDELAQIEPLPLSTSER